MIQTTYIYKQNTHNVIPYTNLVGRLDYNTDTKDYIIRQGLNALNGSDQVGYISKSGDYVNVWHGNDIVGSVNRNGQIYYKSNPMHM